MRLPSVFVAWSLGVGVTAFVGACGWSPSRPFDRQAPAVTSAIKSLGDGGDATLAAATLEDYLTTGPCADGNIGTPETLKRRADGTFDLGLSLFRIGESFGKRFGEEEADGGDPQAKGLRGAEVGCAVRILQQIATDETVPIELRARARYLEGNLDFLDGEYEDAVRAYDKALTLAPGAADAGDRIGRDAAWNRAIALEREEEKKHKDAGHDASQDAHQDSGKDGGKDGGSDGGHDSGHEGGGGGKDSGQDAPHDSGGPDGSKPDASKPQPPQPQDAATPPPPPKASQDDRMLDQLESAPTVQQEAAKKMAAKHRVRGMADK
jgi:tetratricopeptide (TPR) repeat protein